MNTKVDFFCVSLLDNIDTLKQSVPILNSFYDSPNITIVCPDAAVDKFNVELGKYQNVTFAPESNLISANRFRILVDEYAAKFSVPVDQIARINWYYQQCLKICFALQNVDYGKSIVMLDADTILLEKIEFFDKGASKLYGSLSEYNYPYFQTLATIFPQLPKNFLAFTVQFFSCTDKEARSLEQYLENYQTRECGESYGEWVSKIIIQGVMDCHNSFKPALFSEQELFGISNMLYSRASQEKIIHLRYGLDGPLSEMQIRFIRLLGFKHLTYEPIQKFINPQQHWGSLVKHAFRELYRQRTGKIIRKAKRRIARFERNRSLANGL